MRRIAFSLIGGSHQFLHGAPVAAALSRRSDTEVEVFVVSERDAQFASDMLVALGARNVTITVLKLPAALEWMAASKRPFGSLKRLRLYWWSARIRAFDCVVALERTSACLTKLPGGRPLLIQIPHGVGGARRAGGSGIDPRFSSFDLALVAGEDDMRSVVELNLLPQDRVAVVGQIKLAGLHRLGKLELRRLFPNDRPTVLYNPHFHPLRGTWDRFARTLIRDLATSRKFNLIVAPHIRLFADRSREERDAMEALNDPDWLIVDLGSSRSMDMTYTLGADIYLGDFSSQLYEWLIHPRPCVFIDQLRDGGAGDTKLPTMWSLGETIGYSSELMPALNSAVSRHEHFVSRQAEVMRDAVGNFDMRNDEVAADKIIDFLDARTGRPTDR